VRCSNDFAPIGWSELDQAASFDSISEWVPSRFEFIAHLQLASGNYGRVDIMRSATDRGKSMAVKVMPNKWMTSGHQEFTTKYPHSNELPWRDIAMIKKLNDRGCPYACDFLGIYRDSVSTYVVTSLATEGDLVAWCDRVAPRPGRACEKKMLPIVSQIVAAVRWLHDIGVAHRDLSLENILLTKDDTGIQQVKLIDFGMLTLARKCINEERGKRSYQAPEMHVEDEYYDAYLVDAFAVGVIVFSMAARDYPWTSTKPGACKCFNYVRTHGFQKFIQRRVLRRGNYKQLLADVFSVPLAVFVGGLLDFDPNTRLTLGESCWNEDGGPPRKSVASVAWLNQDMAGRCTTGRCTRGSCNMM
jgi:serine/threonine protein kinase